MDDPETVNKSSKLGKAIEETEEENKQIVEEVDGAMGEYWIKTKL